MKRAFFTLDDGKVIYLDQIAEEHWEQYTESIGQTIITLADGTVHFLTGHESARLDTAQNPWLQDGEE